MKFQINEIQDNQLAFIGLTKRDILNMPPRTYNALMSGNRTSLMRFNKLNTPGLEGSSLDAKLSLERKPDNSVTIRFHPINKVAKNTFNLSKEEIEALNTGEVNFVEKKSSNMQDYLVGVDKETNEFIAINKNHIEVPKKINGIELSENQVKDFKDGKEITVGEAKFRLNPAKELGVTGTTDESFLKSVEFKHSKYNANELLLDLALLTSGAGTVMMIGHLADLLIHTTTNKLKGSGQDDVSRLLNENKSLRDSLAKASPEIANKFEKGEFITPKELKQMIENHLDRHVEVGAIDNLEYKAGFPTGVNAIVAEDNKPSSGTKEEEGIKPEKKHHSVKM